MVAYLRVAAVWCAQMLAAAVLAVLAMILQVLGAVFALLTMLFRVVAEVARALGQAIKALMPKVVPLALRVVCVGVAVACNALVFPPVWDAFGGDAVALLPAVALVLAPLSFALMAIQQVDKGQVDKGARAFGGVAVAGLVSFGIGRVLAAVSASVRALVVSGVIASIAFGMILSRKDNEDEQVEWNDFAADHRGGFDGVHGGQVGAPGSNNVAAGQ